MFLQKLQGGDGIGFGDLLVEVGTGREVVKHGDHHSGHDEGVGDVLILVAFVSGNPASEGCGKNGREERHEEQHETDVNAGHDGAAERKAKFLEPPGEAEKHLQ